MGRWADDNKQIDQELARKKILCPFYKRHRDISVTCESYMDHVNAQLNFTSPKKRKAYMDDFCFTDCWRGCPLAQLAGEKYEEE